MDTNRSQPNPSPLDVTVTDFRAFISRDGSTAVVKAHRNDPESPWNAGVWVNKGETYCYGKKFKTLAGLKKWADKELS